MIASAEFPKSQAFWFEKARYKVAFGGRGSAKSWGASRALLIQGAQDSLRMLCGRETQKSINDSVHKLLADQIQELNLGERYRVEKSTIYGYNGSEINFAGLKHNINNLKSLESYDRAWLEEAATVSKNSWEVLIPTLRKDGSEIWATFNPELESDDTYQRFVVKPPPNAIVRLLNWRDNPWFPKVLEDERLHLRAVDYDAYLNVWEGQCRQMLEGAVYANELRAAAGDETTKARIGSVPYDPSQPVHTFWDLGWSDNTSIWFAQAIGFEYRVIDFYQDAQKPLEHYVRKLQEKPYIYGTDWLPHDARANSLGTGRSIEELMRAAGRNVQIVQKLGIADGINAARTIFPLCWFDQARCADGLQALRHYRYAKSEKASQGMPATAAGALAFASEPVHDWSSHAADAFRYMAVALKTPEREIVQRREQHHRRGGWMS
jgi:phage terminase large subunit